MTRPSACETCGSKNWSLVHSGLIRNGAFGNKSQGEVYRCGDCQVDRLDESNCLKEESYETEEYRNSLKQGLSTTDFFKHADPIQIHNLSALRPFCIREKKIADIGAGGGSFLDQVASLAKEVIAIEPTRMYQSSLENRGYKVFDYTVDALEKHRGQLDFVSAFQVIEHVRNPKEFIAEALDLLKPKGKLILSTPNRDDILTKLLPREFSQFFYRTQHRWYFDESSLLRCFKEAASAKAPPPSFKFRHTFGMSNAMGWLRDRQPIGDERLEGINEIADDLWASFLNGTKQSDTIYIIAEK